MSRSEDPLRCFHSSRTEPRIRSRPLSDIYPLQSHPERNPVPCLLSGCSAQVQPMTAGPRSDESRLNGINSWSNSVLGQTEGKPYSSRIMRLFSSSKKGPVPAHGPAAECPTSASSNDDSSSHQPWAGFSGLGVVDSFKKLRSSVLQGIQSKAAASNNGDHAHLPNKDMTVNNTDETNLLKTEAEGNNVNNRHFTEQNLATFSQYGSDIDDYDDEDIEVNALTRNSRFSRSIRRAYGAGRIMLHDVEHGRRAGSSRNVTTVTAQEPHQAFKAQTETLIDNRNVKVMSKRSRSTENLPTFKLPASSKAPCTGRPLPQENTQRISLSNGTPNILRTTSFSSVDLRRCTDCHRRSPVKNKTQMQKLIGSMTDLTIRRKQSPSSSPTSPSLMSPLSRLHDDYSRRVPFPQTNERQRRPVSVLVGSVEHTLLVHHKPENTGDVQVRPVVIRPLPLEPTGSTEQISAGIPAQHEPLAPTTSYQLLNEGFSSSPSQKETSQRQERAEDNCLSNEVRQQTVQRYTIVGISLSVVFIQLLPENQNMLCRDFLQTVQSF